MRGSPLILALVSALVGCIPLGDLPSLAAPLAWLAGSVLRIRRVHVEEAMARAGIAQAEESAWRMYLSLGQGILELLWLAAGERDLSRVALVDPSSRPLLERALRDGRGAVIGASHTGNWELTAYAMAQTRPLSVLVKPVSLGVFDRFMKQVRKQYGVGLLSGEGALGLARQELSLGRLVALLVDQVPSRESHGEWLEHLGAPALTDRSPAALAASSGCPLVMTASRRGEDGRHWLHVLSVRWPPARGRAEWVRMATRETARELAEFVMRHPDQWLWLHRRWKRPALT